MKDSLSQTPDNMDFGQHDIGGSVLQDMQMCLESRKKRGMLRCLPAAPPSGQADFSSNDYLSLARSLPLRNAIGCEANSQWEEGMPQGATGSRLLSGNSVYCEKVERDLARWHKGQTALLFNSGYAANLGFFGSVPQHSHTVVYDESIHNSVREGLKLCRARCVAFQHNCVSDVKEKLAACAPGTAIVAVEAVYSMDGDCAPLAALCDVCDQYQASLVVDEAHSLGLYGKDGMGLVDELGLCDRVLCRMFPYGKALGAQGGAVIGPAVLKEYLVNYARSFIYSTALPLFSLAAIHCGYQVMINADAERKRLHENVEMFRTLIKSVDVTVIDSNSAIQVVLVPGNDNVDRVSAAVQASGYHVLPIKSPTVAQGTERLRVVIHAHNTLNDVRGLVQAIRLAVQGLSCDAIGSKEGQ